MTRCTLMEMSQCKIRYWLAFFFFDRAAKFAPERSFNNVKIWAGWYISEDSRNSLMDGTRTAHRRVVLPCPVHCTVSAASERSNCKFVGHIDIVKLNKSFFFSFSALKTFIKQHCQVLAHCFKFCL